MVLIRERVAVSIRARRSLFAVLLLADEDEDEDGEDKVEVDESPK